jgi:hypothetical protein
VSVVSSRDAHGVDVGVVVAAEDVDDVEDVLPEVDPAGAPAPAEVGAGAGAGDTLGVGRGTDRET